MAHPRLIEALRSHASFGRLVQGLAARTDIRVGALTGSARSALIAALAGTRPHRLWVAALPTPADAEATEADLRTLLDGEEVRLFPQRENLGLDAGEPHFEISALRVEALEALLAGRARVLVTTVRAMQERAAVPARVADLRLSLRRSQSIRPTELAEQLEAMGFERVALVEGVGEYAVRGGILDLFGFGAPEPIRLEFWGDELTSIRSFDILNQRSTRELERVDVLPLDLAPNVTGDDATEMRTRSLLELLPGDAVVVEIPRIELADLESAWSRLGALHAAETRRGVRPAPLETLMMPPAEAEAALASFTRLGLDAERGTEPFFDARPAEPIDRDMDRLRALLRTGAARGEETLILCDNAGQLERMEELLGADTGGLPPDCAIAIGSLQQGFVLESAEPPLRVLTDHEIFRRERRLRRARRFRGAAALESLAQLRPRDFVVHLDHGIGQFLRLEHVRVGGQELEALVVEYAGGEILRVPVDRLDLIERWVPDRDDATAPRLHKIGGRSWKTLRRRTERAIETMTAELLELYAARQLARGHAFPPDTRWQKEMESSFLYEDTPDQRQATTDVKRDMEAPRPMDRLICGDVGYGKTEVAIRAAFKAVQDGKQVAVLAPTTILVEQHLQTFRQRLADYPVRTEGISRFRRPAEQRAILAATAEGNADILIGTHRLLEPDVLFKDLGLLVVDEEQRFGVRQKERFKEMKRSIDVLAMTATPIPRTLHLSLAGLRDLSLIQTPPRDRMPIITHVLPWIDETLRDAILRELDRGGQVFFVHNRVQSLPAVAERVAGLVPEAAIGTAHGQLPAAELDDVMRRFLAGEIQVLATTAIIENGLDVPTANTLIVDRADQFGLAQLYQLRGRVGRSHHRAYCFLVAPEGIDSESERRLRILEHYTDLGAGYAISLKDLELRGGGNILGADQSGFVHAVGIDTYTRLLEQTVRRLQGQVADQHEPPEIAVSGASFLPDAYVPDPAQKLNLYRRLARLEDPAETAALRVEMRDRYGPLPEPAERLLGSAALRILGTRTGVERIIIRGEEARVNFRDNVIPRLTMLQTALRDRQVQVEVRRTMPLSLVLRRLGAEPLLDTVAAALEILADDQARAA